MDMADEVQNFTSVPQVTTWAVLFLISLVAVSIKGVSTLLCNMMTAELLLGEPT